MNIVVLSGRISLEPKVYALGEEKVKTSFGLATSKDYKNKDGNWETRAQFHNIGVFRETKLQKGDLIEVTGELTHRTYEDKQGNKRTFTEVIANTTKFISRPKKKDSIPNANENNLSGEDFPQQPEGDLPF